MDIVMRGLQTLGLLSHCARFTLLIIIQLVWLSIPCIQIHIYSLTWGQRSQLKLFIYEISSIFIYWTLEFGGWTRIHPCNYGWIIQCFIRGNPSSKLGCGPLTSKALTPHFTLSLYTTIHPWASSISDSHLWAPRGWDSFIRTYSSIPKGPDHKVTTIRPVPFGVVGFFKLRDPLRMIFILPEPLQSSTNHRTCASPNCGPQRTFIQETEARPFLTPRLVVCISICLIEILSVWRKKKNNIT